MDKTVVDKPAAAIGDRRAAIELQETRDKNIRDKNSQRPETIDRTMSALNHREATISTANESTMKPQMVVKYQDSLTSASATNMARFPASTARPARKSIGLCFVRTPPKPPTHSPALRSRPPPVVLRCKRNEAAACSSVEHRARSSNEPAGQTKLSSS